VGIAASKWGEEWVGVALSKLGEGKRGGVAVSERDPLRVVFRARKRGVSSHCLWGECLQQIKAPSDSRLERGWWVATG